MAYRLEVRECGSRNRIGHTAVCIAPLLPGLNWSLGPLYEQEDVPRNARLAREIEEALARLEISTAYAPSVATMSGVIVRPHELSTVIKLSSRVELRRNKGLASDGTWVEQKQAFVMSGGGCQVIAVTAGQKFIAAHASRESLLDRAHIIDPSVAPRTHSSVVFAIAAALEEEGIDPAEATFRSYFAIDPRVFRHSFDDPTNGDFHKKTIVHVARNWPEAIRIEDEGSFLLDTNALAASQARQAGFRDISSGGILPINGVYGYTRHDDLAMKTQRNFVVVYPS